MQRHCGGDNMLHGSPKNKQTHLYCTPTDATSQPTVAARDGRHSARGARHAVGHWETRDQWALFHTQNFTPLHELQSAEGSAINSACMPSACL
mmetsp:Transcript_4527/g.13727  ORF Transcript_4527/g.13727 Transcript_4527/m.13727 type:complete len:93 (-) Transcript_4527:39-317(-)